MDMLFTTTDNKWEKPLGDQYKALEPLLQEFSGKKLSDKTLKDKYRILDARVFAGRAQSQEHSEASKDRIIWRYDSHKKTLTTNNIVAWLGNASGQIQVHSRFDTSEQQYFLQYMLYKVFCPHLLESQIDWNIANGLDILPLLFVPLLQSAYSQHGSYKEYTTQEANDARVRGPVDLARHLRKNIPFQGKISYRLRQHQYDNRINRLIRHTADYLESQPSWRGLMQQVQGQDPLLREALNLLKQHCLPVQKNQRRQILKEAEKPVRSPYYHRYEELRSLCCKILQYEQLSLQGQRESFGILLDIAWLWEEYLAVLMPEGITHAYARHTSGKMVFNKDSGRTIFPDFYSKAHSLVMDAKYKRLDNSNEYKRLDNSNEISRDDLYQMISYMYILQSRQGFLLYPLEDADKSREEKGKLNGYGGILGRYGFLVPSPDQARNFAEFRDTMRAQEKELREWIKKVMACPEPA